MFKSFSKLTGNPMLGRTAGSIAAKKTSDVVKKKTKSGLAGALAGAVVGAVVGTIITK